LTLPQAPVEVGQVMTLALVVAPALGAGKLVWLFVIATRA